MMVMGYGSIRSDSSDPKVPLNSINMLTATANSRCSRGFPWNCLVCLVLPCQEGNVHCLLVSLDPMLTHSYCMTPVRTTTFLAVNGCPLYIFSVNIPSGLTRGRCVRSIRSPQVYNETTITRLRRHQHLHTTRRAFKSGYTIKFDT
jgi:hypothetical protein